MNDKIRNMSVMNIPQQAKIRLGSTQTLLATIIR